MGLFDKFKKKREASKLRQTEGEKGEEIPNTDYVTKPGGVFVVQLLMKGPCQRPSGEQVTAVLSRHIGAVDLMGSGELSMAVSAKEHIAHLADSELPVMFGIVDCDGFDEKMIEPFKRQQIWEVPDRDQILSACKYQVMAHETFGGGLSTIQERAELLMDFVEGLLELYPTCEAVYFSNSGKLVMAETIRSQKATGLDRFIQYAVNVRLFDIDGTQDKLVDTIGLSLLRLADLQYHFHTLDSNYGVFHAYNMAAYLLKSGQQIKDGDTIDGIRDDRLDPAIQWRCRCENALVGPPRMVIDVSMGEYAAGERDRGEDIPL